MNTMKRTALPIVLGITFSFFTPTLACAMVEHKMVNGTIDTIKEVAEDCTEDYDDYVLSLPASKDIKWVELFQFNDKKITVENVLKSLRSKMKAQEYSEIPNADQNSNDEYDQYGFVALGKIVVFNFYTAASRPNTVFLGIMGN